MAQDKDLKTPNVPPLRFPGFADEWVEMTIQNLATVLGGGTPDTTNQSYWDGNIQWFTPSEIGKNKYVNTSLRTITEDGLNNSAAKLLPPHTILLSSRATVGECSLTLQECATNQGFQSLIAKNCNTDFLYYLIQTKKKELIKKSCGSTFLEISANEVRKIKVSIPTKDEQLKISHLLSLIDERISTQNKIIDNLQSLIKGLNDVLLKQVCKNAEKVRLGEICNITTGKLDANAMEDNGIYPFFTCAKTPYLINSYAFDTEALLISGNGANVGYINYYNGKFNAYQRTYVLDGFSENIQYIRIFLKIYLPKRIALEKSTSNTPYIVISTLSNMPIFLPNKTDQDKICQMINGLETKLSIEKSIFSTMISTKHYLLEKLFI